MIEEAQSQLPVINNQLKLFVPNSSRTFGEQVSRRLAEPSLHEEREFEDGEHKARPLTSVRGKNVFVIQSLYADHQKSGDDKLCWLFFYRCVGGRRRRTRHGGRSISCLCARG